MSPFQLRDLLKKYNLSENDVRVFLMTKSFMDDHPDDDESNFRKVYFGKSRFTTAKWLSIVPKKMYSCKFVLLCFSLGNKEWIIEGLYKVLGPPVENQTPDRTRGEARWNYPMKRINDHDFSANLSLRIKFIYEKRQNYVLCGETVSLAPVFVLPEKVDFSPIFDRETSETNVLPVNFKKIAERYIFFIKNNDKQALWENRRWMSADSMDKEITIGKSKKWTSSNSWREHIVPCIMIHEKLIELGKDERLEEMIDILKKYLKIVLISQEESAQIDFGLGLKTKMPNGWQWGNDSMARLKAGNVKLVKIK